MDSLSEVMFFVLLSKATHSAAYPLTIKTSCICELNLYFEGL